MTVHSVSQHTTTWWSDRKLVRKKAGLRDSNDRAFHHSAQYHMLVRCGKLEREEAGLRDSNHRGFHHSTQYHLLVRWGKLVREEAGLRDSNHPAFHQTTQYHTVVTSKAFEERGGA